jgi:hypothetical protein
MSAKSTLAAEKLMGNIAQGMPDGEGVILAIAPDSPRAADCTVVSFDGDKLSTGVQQAMARLLVKAGGKEVDFQPQEKGQLPQLQAGEFAFVHGKPSGVDMKSEDYLPPSFELAVSRALLEKAKQLIPNTKVAL